MHEVKKLYGVLLYNVLVNCLFSKSADFLNVSLAVLESVLLDVEERVIDKRNSFYCRLVSLVVLLLELNVLELEGVEVLAKLLDLLFCKLFDSLTCEVGVAVLCNSLRHCLLKKTKCGIESVTASLLSCLALKEHSLSKLITNLHNGVKRGHGILEDHSDFITTDLVEVLLADLEKILTVVNDLTGLDDSVTCKNTKNGLGGYGLTGAGLTNDSESFTLVKVKIDISNGLNLAVYRFERYS